MASILPFRIGIDHGQKHLRMILKGADGKEVRANIDLNQIAEFMTVLSNCQHALVFSKATNEVHLPFDPIIAFTPEAGTSLLGAYEVVARAAVGSDKDSGIVALTILSSIGRLTGFRIAPEFARRIGQSLIDKAD
jgi:hypothetical protein